MIRLLKLGLFALVPLALAYGLMTIKYEVTRVPVAPQSIFGVPQAAPPLVLVLPVEKPPVQAVPPPQKAAPAPVGRPAAPRRPGRACSIFYTGLGGQLFGAGIDSLADRARRQGKHVIVAGFGSEVDTRGCSSVEITGHSMGAITAVRQANELHERGVQVTVTPIDPPGWAGTQQLDSGIPCHNYFQHQYPGGGHVSHCQNTDLNARGYGHVNLPFALERN